MKYRDKMILNHRNVTKMMSHEMLIMRNQGF